MLGVNGNSTGIGWEQRVVTPTADHKPDIMMLTKPLPEAGHQSGDTGADIRRKLATGNQDAHPLTLTDLKPPVLYPPVDVRKAAPLLTR